MQLLNLKAENENSKRGEHMSSIDDLLKELKESLTGLADGVWHDYKEGVVKDGTDFLNNIKDDLELWSRQLAEGELSPDDFTWLVKSKKNLVQLEALKEIGLAKAKLDKFVNDLIDTIVSKTIGSVL